MKFEMILLAKALFYFHFTSSDTLPIPYPVFPGLLSPSLNIASAVCTRPLRRGETAVCRLMQDSFVSKEK